MRHFIVIEGLIGVGKTTLSRLLQREWGAQLVLEPAATNPFLESFYRDPTRYALPVQVYYLLTRWQQQADIAQGDLFTQVVVSDYLFEKDRLFAEKTLPAHELTIYGRLSDALGVHAPKPDLVVFLDAPTDVILDRIANRGAPGEEVIEAAYLDDLRERYGRLLEDWTECPILRLDNRDMDYVRDPAGQQAVLKTIRSALESGMPSEPPGSPGDREGAPTLFGG
ncbi:MAG: deoxyguanosine kinase [Myxococcota bacterium]